MTTSLAGGAISLQSYLNGQLGSELGSPDGRRGDQQPRRDRRDADRRARDAARPPRATRGCARSAAHRCGTSSAASAARRSCWSRPSAAPEVGVALLTVALVCGSTGGSLPVDAAGLGPAGRRPITLPRVARRAAGDHRDDRERASARAAHPDVLLLSLAVGAGVLMSLQAAANGQLAQRDGRAVGRIARQRRRRLRGARRRARSDARDVRDRRRCRATRCGTSAACSARSSS